MIIKGVTVALVSKIETGKDPFGEPVFTESEIEVDNVLISPTTSDDIVNQLTISGKKAVYTLAIPKGDTNTWEDQEVRFFGERWRVFGITMQGIDHLIPMAWNKKVTVERYD